jgi:hypothetical protein
MSERPEIKITRKKPTADESALDVPAQPKRTEALRFRLKVDRQTKSSYPTFDVAEAAGLAIKQGHPIVQVAVYDSVEGTNTAIELSKA